MSAYDADTNLGPSSNPRLSLCSLRISTGIEQAVSNTPFVTVA
jgi:hypothetical protein